MRMIRPRTGTALLALGLALIFLVTAPPARAEFDFYSLPVIRWFVGFGSFNSERDRLVKALTCARTADDRMTSGIRRFSCLGGDRNRIQVFLESPPQRPDEVQRVLFRWRTGDNAKVGLPEPPSAADRSQATETLRRLAEMYVGGKANELVAMLGQPSTGRVSSRGYSAAYLLFADPAGDQYIVGIEDNDASRARAREASLDEAGMTRCRSPIRGIPRYANMELSTTRQRKREEGDHVSYLLASQEATFVCEFYPNGYYRILGGTKDGDEFGFIAHGLN